ncbi:MAG: hypothetical protein SGPRY_012551, partial [Prymnesium sp.]
MPGNIFFDGAAFDNLAKLKKNTTPVQVCPSQKPSWWCVFLFPRASFDRQIVHGINDPVIRVSCAHDLYRICSEQHPLPPVYIAESGHEPERSHVRDFVKAASDFIDHVKKLTDADALSTDASPSASMEEDTPLTEENSLVRIARALSWERKPQTSREAVSPGQAHTAAANATLESPPCVATKTVAEDEQENTIFHRVARTLSWDRKPRSGDAAPSSSGTSAECKESNTVCSSNSTRAGSGAASIGVVEAQSQEDDSIFHHLARALSWDRKPRSGNASRSADPNSKLSASRGDTARTSNDAQEEDTIFHQLARALSWERKPRTCRAARLNTETYSPGPGARVREECSLSKPSDVHTASTESQEEDTFAQQVSRMISGEAHSRSDSPDAKSHP